MPWYALHIDFDLPLTRKRRLRQLEEELRAIDGDLFANPEPGDGLYPQGLRISRWRHPFSTAWFEIGAVLTRYDLGGRGWMLPLGTRCPTHGEASDYDGEGDTLCRLGDACACPPTPDPLSWRETGRRP